MLRRQRFEGNKVLPCLKYWTSANISIPLNSSATVVAAFMSFNEVSTSNVLSFVIFELLHNMIRKADDWSLLKNRSGETTHRVFRTRISTVRAKRSWSRRTVHEFIPVTIRVSGQIIKSSSCPRSNIFIPSQPSTAFEIWFLNYDSTIFNWVTDTNSR